MTTIEPLAPITSFCFVFFFTFNWTTTFVKFIKSYNFIVCLMLSFLKNYHFIIRSEFIKIRIDHIKSFIYNIFMASSLTIFLVEHKFLVFMAWHNVLEIFKYIFFDFCIEQLTAGENEADTSFLSWCEDVMRVWGYKCIYYKLFSLCFTALF